MTMTESAPEANPAVVLEYPNPNVIVIRLVRESRRNTLSAQLIDALDAALIGIAASPPRAVIVTGQGKAFCAGAEISGFVDEDSPLRGNPLAIAKGYLVRILEVFRRLRCLPCPTIAAVNGHAMGGGLELALNCDFRIAAKGVMVGFPEVRLGIVAAAAGVQQVQRIVGRAKALEMLLLGDRFTADEACRFGLVTSVCDPQELEASALEFAQRFQLCAPEAVAETKRAIYRSESLGLDDADEVAMSALHFAASSPDFAEGMAAFVEKRPAVFGNLPARAWTPKKGSVT